MMPETTFHRQLKILPPDRTKTPITIIGCGGIGSVTALCIAKIGFENLTLYDPDIVETHNLPSQFFHPNQINLNKAEAISNIILGFTSIITQFNRIHWDNTQPTTPIIISAVDSMKIRKEIWDHMKTRFDVELYIDARMSAEKMRIYAFNPADEVEQKFYEAQLYDDEEANEEECTAKAIAYNTFVIGGIVASLVKKHVMHEELPREFIFDLQNYGLYKA